MGGPKASDDAEIREFIRLHGITRCPARKATTKRRPGVARREYDDEREIDAARGENGGSE